MVRTAHGRRSTGAPRGWPARVEPMLALASRLPRDPERWAFEFKWDGVRALVYLDGHGGLRVESRRGLDVTARWPELAGLPEALAGRVAILDGEIVALGPGGRPSFEALQGRMNLEDPRRARALARLAPVHLFVFDLLFLDGRSLLREPWRRRRARLEALAAEAPEALRLSPAFEGEGAALLEAARREGIEGVVAKRVDSVYEPGRRTGAWRKTKNTRRQELVVGGWLPGEGGRRGRIGALLVGYYEDGVLRYAGRVGTGFTERELDRLAARLAPLTRGTSPFVDAPEADAVYVEPVLVAEVELLEWTTKGRIRAPSYKGLRDDKDPREVVRERPDPQGGT